MSSERLRELQAQHWLYHMACEHTTGQDQAACACGWLSGLKKNVGEAAIAWWKHAEAALAASGPGQAQTFNANLVEGALLRVEQRGCSCDAMNGWTCGIHEDVQQLRAALAQPAIPPICALCGEPEIHKCKLENLGGHSIQSEGAKQAPLGHCGLRFHERPHTRTSYCTNWKPLAASLGQQAEEGAIGNRVPDDPPLAQPLDARALINEIMNLHPGHSGFNAAQDLALACYAAGLAARGAQPTSQYETGRLFGRGEGLAKAAEYVRNHDNLGDIAADEILALALPGNWASKLAAPATPSLRIGQFIGVCKNYGVHIDMAGAEKILEDLNALLRSKAGEGRKP